MPRKAATYAAGKRKLNPEQRSAVEAIDGPVMVIAGPGTGKTQVLALRVAEILVKSDLSPRNILALAFTESAASAMRERLLTLIGPAAYMVAVYTFHGFANRLITESGAEFYHHHRLEPISEIDQLKLIIKLVDGQKASLRPVRAPHWYVKPIIQAIRRLKNEGITPSQLKELVRRAIDQLGHEAATGQTVAAGKKATGRQELGKTGSRLKRVVEEKINRLERTLALADLYARYQAALKEQGRYDFEDMIIFVINLLTENTLLKAKYQEQFQSILVDEYQDTNNAQNALLNLLVDYDPRPNLFVVGDDRQSIYRFQGASMANLLAFHQNYPTAKLVTLRQNYRSGQTLLDQAQSLIAHNREQLASQLPQLAVDLVGQPQGSRVVYTSYTTTNQEALAIVSKIAALMKEGLAPSEIAIIYRENREAAIFADLLRRQGIAFHLEGGDDILDDPDILELVNLLTLTANPHDDQAFFRYLHAPFSDLTDIELARLGHWRRTHREDWAKSSPRRPSELPRPLWEKLLSRRVNLAAWHRFSLHHSLGETAEHLLLDAGLLSWLMTQEDYLPRLHRLRSFFDEVKAVMGSGHFVRLDDLLATLNIRRRYNLPLISPPLPERSEGAVRLLTAHKAKGLEFETVFIPHFYDGLWSNSHRPEAITFPEGIISHHRLDPEQAIEEERRLAYVAITRAKAAVYLSSPQFDEENRRLIPSQFLHELGEVPVLEPETSLTVEAFFTSPKPAYHRSESQAYLQELVSQMPLTPTSLNTYLACPREYLYQHVYAIPGVREPYQAYGTAVHKALELWGDWSRGTTRVTRAKILTAFEEALRGEGLAAQELATFLSLGQKVLTAYWERAAKTWVVPLAVEYSFTPHHVRLNGRIPLTGKLDKIEPIAGSPLVRVIDFKTGRAQSRRAIEGATAGRAGDYKRQLIFYTLLAESDPAFPFTIGETVIAFLDDNLTFATEVFRITAQEKAELKRLITTVYDKICALEFDHKPHHPGQLRSGSLCDLLRPRP